MKVSPDIFNMRFRAYFYKFIAKGSRMRESIFKFSIVTFLLTLFVYVLTLTYVSYVGVKLTYVAVPVIVISGLIAYLTRPKEIINKIKEL